MALAVLIGFCRIVWEFLMSLGKCRWPKPNAVHVRNDAPISIATSSIGIGTCTMMIEKFIVDILFADEMAGRAAINISTKWMLLFYNAANSME